MSRPSSSFFRTSTPLSPTDRSQSPLLPLHEHRHSVSLQTLSPRSSLSPEPQRRASPSPSPSFYRDIHNSPSRQSTFAHPYSDIHPSRLQERSDLHGRNEGRGRARASLSPSSTHSHSFRRCGQNTQHVMFPAPPPPIAQSVFLTPQFTTLSTTSSTSQHPGSRGSSRTRTQIAQRGLNPLALLARREKEIQANLQGLLDAQSTGLLHGFGGGQDGTEGSNTPTTHSINGRNVNGKGAVRPVRQPKPSKPLTLRGARRGLLKEMSALVLVKEEESQLLTQEMGYHKGILGKIDNWEERIIGVKGKLKTSEDVGEEEEGLKREESALDNEIAEVEERLLLLKKRKRMVGERIKESVNKREAGMSSYRGALVEVESEVKEFLNRTIPASKNRRTLEIVRTQSTREIESLQEKQEACEKEKEASENGVRLWRECCEKVVEFEDALRVVIISQQKRDAGGDVHADGEVLKRQIDKMGDVIDRLEGVRKEAEGKGWNLLVCAVGAEAEAFKQGRGILMGALGFEEDAVRTNIDEDADGGGGEGDLKQRNGIEELDDSDEGTAQIRLIDDDEDEGPNLDLLIERGSTDDE